MNIQQIWQAVLGELELKLSKVNFTTWFKNTSISAFEEDKVIICVPNNFTRAWMEKKYHTDILKALQNITQVRIREIIYKVEAIKQIQEQQRAQLEAFDAPSFAEPRSVDSILPRPAILNSYESPVNESGLNTKYLFDNFIVGKNNELAHAAGLSVAGSPGYSYNPLFIYGGVGLGKTHLIQAIGNDIIHKFNNNKKVLYVTMERFTNDFIQSVQRGAAKDFKDTYRNIDVLLIDDIQFISGKERSQEELFHTFNELHHQNKQVVMTSDRPPKSIPALEDRLRSRFEWGMIADIQNPDLETRMAILHARCKEKQYPLSQEIVSFVASAVESNIRELEGALNRIIAFHQFKNITPSRDSVKDIISSFITELDKKKVSPKELINIASEYFDINLNEVLGKSREKRLVVPRQIIMFLLRSELDLSFPAIGQVLGNRDHTTAMHACDKVNTEIKSNLKIKKDIELIKDKIYKSY